MVRREGFLRQSRHDEPGDAVLIAKNCHKSVYNAAAMLQRQTIYVEPTWKKEAEDAFAFTSFIDGYVDAR